jgi:geranylgeranyl pyrophosphate synthase
VDFPNFAARHRPALVAALQAHASAITVESLQQAALHLLGRGKLYRPLLVLATAEAVSGCSADQHAGLAAAVELIHTFTLIHDDLPCMDDADLRRGLATVHREYGEATAVLAADALHALAFEVLARPQVAVPSEVQLALQFDLAVAVRAVIEGQSLDLQAEGQAASLQQLEEIHRQKTGALLGACCSIGARLGGAEANVAARLRDIGVQLGLAFQIRDDLLSLQSSEAVAGKTLTTDVAKAKATYPALLGIEGAEAALSQLRAEIKDSLNSLALAQPDPLTAMLAAAVDRTH